MQTCSTVRRRAAALAAAALGFGLSTLSIAAHATGETSCPGSPSRLPFEPPPPTGGEFDELLDPVALTQLPDPMAMPQPLRPGTTQVTVGVPLVMHLRGSVVLAETVPFSFLASDMSVVSGT